MSAKKTGGTAGRQRAKNQAMAAQGVKRTSCRCPICHKLVGLGVLPTHIMTCNGR